VHALNEKPSGTLWWNTLGEHSDDWCWVGSYNSVYQLDSFLCMRSKLQQRGLSPLIVLDAADAALRTVDRTQVGPVSLYTFVPQKTCMVVGKLQQRALYLNVVRRG